MSFKSNILEKVGKQYDSYGTIRKVNNFTERTLDKPANKGNSFVSQFVEIKNP